MTFDNDLQNLRAHGWEEWRFGPDSGPFGEVFLYRWPAHADILVLCSRISAVAYRTPLTQGVDPFSPELIHWSFGGR